MLDNFLQDFLKNTNDKINQEQKKFENTTIDYQSTDKKISLKLNANYKILDIKISPELLNDHEMLEDLLVVNLNRAIEKVKNKKKTQINDVKNEMMPNINDILNSIKDTE